MIWLVPVIVISSIWPLYCIATNQFGDWLDGVLYQAEREERGISRPLLDLFEIDPLFAILSVIAIAFAIFRVIRLKDRDLFIFFWTVPYFLFLLLIGGVCKVLSLHYSSSGAEHRNSTFHYIRFKIN